MKQFARFAIAASLTVALTGSSQSARAADAQRPAGDAATQVHLARGIVYDDVDRDGVRDEVEIGLAGIRVSNGRDITETNADGRYELPVNDDTILFVIKPRNWMTSVDADQLPRFYYIHKPSGSPSTKFAGVKPTGELPASVDFGLIERAEPDAFKAILFGDTQPRDVREVEYIAHDVVEPIIAEQGHGAALGITLGDVVFDDLSVNEPLIKTISMIGLPWYNVLGNHDMNYDSADDRYSDETFEATYGPATYSFDHGPVHFVVIDNVHWVQDQETGRGRYEGRIGDERLEFIKNDLSLVPDDQLVVLMMHIPLHDTKDCEKLFRLIENRPHTLSLSAHTHRQQHHFYGEKEGWKGPEPHHHLNHATVCGSWWSGTPDENRIPHATMSDGAPNGYSIVSFDGANYEIDFRAARRPASHQMHIHAPEQLTADAARDAQVLINVYAGSEKSKVEMKVDGQGDWVMLDRLSIEDPFFVEMKQAEASVKLAPEAGSSPQPNPLLGRKLPNPGKCPHIWEGRLPEGLPPGLHLIQVRTTDMFGKTYAGNRSIRIVNSD